VLFLLLSPACRRKPPAQPPAPPAPQRQSLFILLPEEGHPASAVVVSNQAGSQTIDQPYHVVRVANNVTVPAPAVPIDPAEVNRRFGALLASLPAAAETFAVNFDLSQGAISAESRPQIALIVAAIQNRRSTSVTVIGHTDTTGEAQANYTLGLQRAEAVAAEIRAVAPPGAQIFVASHGESDPAVKTADGVDEPRNRRVEVIVR
jgi:outer membrane protein OmpA-like peptidoglycan-associated protein